ncbi:Retrovirus-related Pol polyprotein from transposon TNT 1-94 [Dendrobium catenatum]|uniref:Retrovirus-related Pol polyprotein from transposon TNT 1-94 n=1 Tax=Dendrobium catenatum TaxID=906689 RepID=A0A2I0VIH5_9ASPA|nr:Retrovirus-related Pol polyprotein from transposon TNT 1-94 [Dendrobium catenatum]
MKSTNNDAWLWHRRLCHANIHTLNKISKLDLVVGLPKISFHFDSICDACIHGKHMISSFKSKNIVSTSRHLELVHIDLFGPINTTSLGGKSYGFVIVDDYSRYNWVLFLGNKNNAFDDFRKFSKYIQREQGYLIHRIQTNYGGEFENKSFQNYCDENGIRHNFSAPRTPQQNGTVETKNRTLVELARSMLDE